MSRSVVKCVLSVEQSEGRGARVRRSIGRLELRNLDPFLMLDEVNIKDLSAGFPDHPHRGFETVTYVLQGAIQHEDFCGHAGVIQAGGLQWMTAGRGIVHSEMPCGELPGKGLQLWVNLRAKDKMTTPEYQELDPSEIPVATRDKVTVKVIAGESMGTKSQVRTRTPTHYLDFYLQPGGAFKQPTEPGWTVFAYILSGTIEFGSNKQSVEAHHTVVFSDGEYVEFANRSEDTEAHFVLIAGEPIKEPVFQHGPFVMNTSEEIQQTFRDYQTCRNGFENARNWRSKHGNVH